MNARISDAKSNLAARIETLSRTHDVDTFDCGSTALNAFLVRYAYVNQQAGASRTYVLLMDTKVIGYYTLVVGEVTHDVAPPRISKGLPRYPIPIMVLARLAVRLDWQGQGVGSGLLKDAMLRTLQAADIAGIRALAVHAKDDRSRAFYERFDFVQAPSDRFHLFVLLKDIRGSLAR